MAYDRRVLGVLALMLLIAGCSSEQRAAGDCPVSSPPPIPFVPPEPWPAAHSSSQWTWFGTEELWTVVATEDWMPRKSI